MTANIINIDPYIRYRAKARGQEIQSNSCNFCTGSAEPILLTPCTSFSLPSDNLAELDKSQSEIQLDEWIKQFEDRS